MHGKTVTPELVDALVRALVYEDAGVRGSACEVLGKIDGKAVTSEVVGALVGAIGDEDNWVRISACQALDRMGEKTVSPESVERLVRALGDQNVRVRRNVCEVLAKMGVKVRKPQVIDRLMVALAEEDDSVRYSAYQSLRRICEETLVHESDRDGGGESNLSDVIKLTLNERYSAPIEIPTIDAEVFGLDSEKHTGGMERIPSAVDNWPKSERMLRACMRSHDPHWLVCSIGALLSEGEACYVVGEEVSIVWRQKSVKVEVSEKKLLDTVRAVMSKQRKEVFGCDHFKWNSSGQ
jgi:HEAT repeat protein